MSIIIYKITSSNGPKTYVGSTRKKYLCNRKADHRSKYKLKKDKCASYELFDEYGVDNCIFEEIERVDESVRFNRERYWIEILQSVNYNRPITTKEEKLQQKRDLFQKFKIEKNEDYKERNKKSNDQQKENASRVIECECGLSYTHGHKNRHLKSKFHNNYI